MAQFDEGSGEVDARGWRRLVCGWVATLACAVCLLASCSTPGTSDADSKPDDAAASTPSLSGPADSPPASPTSPSGEPTGGQPTVPATDDVATLAHQLNRAAAT